MATRIWMVAALATLALVISVLISVIGGVGVDVGRDDVSATGAPGSPAVLAGPRDGDSGLAAVVDPATSRPVPRADALDKDPLEERELASGSADIVVLALDDGGRQIPEVDVTLRAESGKVEMRGSRQVTTDARGEAVFEGILPGSYSIGVVDPGLRELTSARQLTVGSGERKLVELRVGDFDLSIAGRVIDIDGEPLVGLVVQARAYATGSSTLRLVPASRDALAGRTDDEGRYEIDGLDEGEYEVVTTRTKDYPSVRQVVRSGLQSADFVIAPEGLIPVHGVVVDERSGEPLEGVRVVPLGSRAEEVKTRENGSFDLHVSLRSNQLIYTVEFVLDGYSTDRRSLRIEELRQLEAWQIDIGLTPSDTSTFLTGFLVGPDGSVLSGETVHVHSASQRVRGHGVSDEQGRFEISGVQPASDYRVWVYPSGSWRDLIRENLVVPEDGLYVDLELQPLGEGTLSGRLVDVEGNPVPHFSLWVNSVSALNKPRHLSSGPEGEYFVEGVPTGNLIFQTRSAPRFTLRGLRLEEGQDVEMDLVLDWGTQQLGSRVVDPDGKPVAVARVDLYWERSWGSGRATSYRNARTDRDGFFHFTQVGPGKHRLSITAKGFVSRRIEIDVGVDDAPQEIQLER